MVDGSFLVIHEVVKLQLSKTMYLALINFLELSHPSLHLMTCGAQVTNVIYFVAVHEYANGTSAHDTVLEHRFSPMQMAFTP